MAKREKFLVANCNSLHDFKDMPKQINSVIRDARNMLTMDERSYDVHEMRAEHATLYLQLTSEQKGGYDKIMEAVD